MDWMGAVDAYCERIGPAYWAEPINAVTNVVFLLAAFVMWRRTAGMPLARLLCLILAAVGVGSYLFHTHAQTWAGMVDVIPIALFILVYLFAVNRAVFGLGTWTAVAATALFFPYAAMMMPVFALVPGFGSSASYAPVALLIYLYAGFLRSSHPNFARGLAIGASILVVSLAFRTLDAPLCDAWPTGTHFMWHLLNGLMLGWMIEVYRRLRLGKHVVAG